MEHDHFKFAHLLDGVLWSFFTEAGVFEAAVGHQVGPPLRPPVDVNVATLDLAGEAHSGVEAAGEDRRRETVAAVVGQGDGLVGGVGGREGHRRAEYLVPRQFGVGMDVGHHRRGEQGAITAAAGNQARAGSHGLRHPLLHAPRVQLPDHGSHPGLFLERVAGRNRLHLGLQGVDQVAVHGPERDNPLGGDANLSGSHLQSFLY